MRSIVDIGSPSTLSGVNAEASSAENYSEPDADRRSDAGHQGFGLRRVGFVLDVGDSAEQKQSDAPNGNVIGASDQCVRQLVDENRSKEQHAAAAAVVQRNAADHSGCQAGNTPAPRLKSSKRKIRITLPSSSILTPNSRPR